MREIKFRGKSKSTGEWVYGLPAYGTEGTVSEIELKDKQGEVEFVQIVPETLGQFTGRVDVKGVEIYEGDLVITIGFGKGVYKVVFSEEDNGFVAFPTKSEGWNMAIYNNSKVVGNIHDEEDEGCSQNTK